MSFQQNILISPEDDSIIGWIGAVVNNLSCLNLHHSCYNRAAEGFLYTTYELELVKRILYISVHFMLSIGMINSII